MYCVIVGDIVNSKQLDQDVRDRVTQAAKDVFARINDKYSSSLMATFGMVRGDAFEGVLLTQYHAPRIVEDIIKAFYHVEQTKVRVSVVLGELTVTGNDRNDTDGPAFYQAWECLKDMKNKKNDHWLQVAYVVGSLAQKLVDSQQALLAALTQGWTDRQREVVWMTQAHDEQKQVVAEQLNISLGAVRKHLDAANYDAYCGAWEGLADYLQKMDEYVVGNKDVIEKSYVSYFNVALRKYEQYDYKTALPLIRKSLELAKEALGENDPLLIQIYDYLADICLFTEMYEQAEEALEKSLKLQENMPKARAQYVYTLYLRARLFLVRDNFEAAQKGFEEALEVAQSMLAEKDSDLSMIYNGLAVAYEKQEKYEKAIEYFVKASNSENTFINYAILAQNIAECYYKMKQYEQARDHIKKALGVFEGNLPHDHKYVVDTRELLADIEAQQGGEAG